MPLGQGNKFQNRDKIPGGELLYMEVQAEACIEGEPMFADPLLVGGHFQLSESAVFAMVAIIVA